MPISRPFFIFSSVLFLLLSAVCPAAEYSGIVAFGDSLSDMGNRWIDSKKPDIKFRQTWVAKLAGPSMLKLPALKPSGTKTFYGGSNYAVGGAGTAATSDKTLARNQGQDLTQQISGRYLNPAFNTGGVQPEALHVIVIGANDLMAASIGLDQVLSQWSGLDKVAAEVARSTEGQIGALAAAGVKHVLWGNVFDVAQAPALVKKAKAFPAVASIYLSAITKAVHAHNAEMDAAIERLRKAHPGLEVIRLDLFHRFTQVAADPAKYGFIDIRTGGNDDRHLFSADGLHPTPQGHKMLAEFAFEVLQKDAAAEAALAR